MLTPWDIWCKALASAFQVLVVISRIRTKPTFVFHACMSKATWSPGVLTSLWAKLVFGYYVSQNLIGEHYLLGPYLPECLGSTFVIFISDGAPTLEKFESTSPYTLLRPDTNFSLEKGLVVFRHVSTTWYIKVVPSSTNRYDNKDIGSSIWRNSALAQHSIISFFNRLEFRAYMQRVLFLPWAKIEMQFLDKICQLLLHWNI